MYVFLQFTTSIQFILMFTYRLADIQFAYIDILDITLYCTSLLVYVYAQHDVKKTADIMELVLPDPLPSWEAFSSVVLRPLRVQMMGSVVVSICAVI